MKYRILRKYGICYPQKRYSGLKWFKGWLPVHVITDINDNPIFKTSDFQIARSAIQRDKNRGKDIQIFNKDL